VIYLLDALVYLVAWTFQGFTGFGAGIFIVGVLSLYHDPREVVVSSTLVNLIGILSVIFLILRRSGPDPRSLLFLITGSVPGIFLGTEVLFSLSERWLRISIGAFIVLLGVYDLAVQRGYGRRFRLRKGAVPGMGFGFMGGFFAGLVGMGGPPPVVYLNQVIEDLHTFKATLTLFFLSNVLFRTAFYLAEGGVGSYDPLMILPAPITVPLGVYLGMVASERVGSRVVKETVSLSVVLLGSALVIREVLW
jgi:uncharacterized membrane protein YfcA